MRRLLSLLLLSACGTPSAPPATPPVAPPEPTPSAPQASAPALDKDPKACASCHPKAFEQWKDSRHSKAFTDGVFLHEFNPLRQAWCAACHAPSAKDHTKVKDDDPLALQGIGCAACHFREGALVSSSKAPTSPHLTVVDQEFGRPSFCGPCHDFNFPILDRKTGALKHYTNLPMQETWRQYKANNIELGCIDCHEPHPSKGAHEVEMLHEALSWSFCRDDKELKISLTNKGAGHHVPSGGIDRHMILRVSKASSETSVMQGFIGRTFRRAESGGKEVVSDTSIKPEETKTFSVQSSALRARDKDPLIVELRYIYAPEETLAVPNAVIWQEVFREEVILSSLQACTPSEQPALPMSPPKTSPRRE